MEPRSEPTNTVWSLPFTPQDWEQTPPAVQAYVRTLSDEVTQLHDRVETLEARLTQNSTTSSKPPSSDSPYKPMVLVSYKLLKEHGAVKTNSTYFAQFIAATRGRKADCLARRDQNGVEGRRPCCLSTVDFRPALPAPDK